MSLETLPAGDLVMWLSHLTGFIGMPAIAIAALLLHYRLKQKSTLTLAIGLMAAVIGMFISFFSPLQGSLTTEQLRDAILQHGTYPVSWYVGDFIFFAGALVACVGFLWLSLSVPKRKGRDI